MFRDLHFYIELDWENHIDNPDQYLKNLYHLVAFVELHKANIYYNQKQVTDFTNQCEDLDKNFIVSYSNLLHLILDNAKPLHSSAFVFEICFFQENSTINLIERLAVSIIQNFDKQAILSDKVQKNPILVASSHDNIYIATAHYLYEILPIKDWIIKNAPTRHFNLSPKHGENGIGNWRGQSKLLCSKSEAQTLLNNAVPHLIEYANRLFNWDETHNTFIEFFYEGDNPQNQWHGFHLERVDWDRVPQTLTKYIKLI